MSDTLNEVADALNVNSLNTPRINDSSYNNEGYGTISLIEKCYPLDILNVRKRWDRDNGMTQSGYTYYCVIKNTGWVYIYTKTQKSVNLKIAESNSTTAKSTTLTGFADGTGGSGGASNAIILFLKAGYKVSFIGSDAWASSDGAIVMELGMLDMNGVAI